MSTGVAVFMPLYVGDYLRDTAELTAAEHGAYMLLIMHLWNRGGELTLDHYRLARLASAAPEQWVDIWEAISHYFVVSGDTIRHKRVDAEIEKAQEKRRLASEAGRKSAEARGQQPKSIHPTEYKPTFNGRSTGVQPAFNSSPSPSPSESSPPISDNCSSKDTPHPPRPRKRASAREVGVPIDDIGNGAWQPVKARLSEAFGGIRVVNAKTGQPLPWVGEFLGVLGKRAGTDVGVACRLFDEFHASRDWQYATADNRLAARFGKWVATQAPDRPAPKRFSSPEEKAAYVEATRRRLGIDSPLPVTDQGGAS